MVSPCLAWVDLGPCYPCTSHAYHLHAIHTYMHMHPCAPSVNRHVRVHAHDLLPSGIEHVCGIRKLESGCSRDGCHTSGRVGAVGCVPGMCVSQCGCFSQLLRPLIGKARSPWGQRNKHAWLLHNRNAIGNGDKAQAATEDKKKGQEGVAAGGGRHVWLGQLALHYVADSLCLAGSS